MICIVVAILLVVVAAIVLALFVMPKSQQAAEPALKAGQTTLSKETYQKMVEQARGGETAANSGAAAIPEQQIKATLTDYVRSSEVARQLGVEVPGYLIAAQQTGALYTPYEQMNDYQKAANYPSALEVLVALQEQGGGIVTMYHLPYATPQDETQTKNAITVIPTSVKDTSAKDDGIHGSALLSSLNDARFNYQDGVNQSGIYAVTDEGMSLRAIGGDALVALPRDQAPMASPVVVSDLPIDFFSIIKSVDIHKFSTPTKTTNPSAYLLVYKDAVYHKNAGIQARYGALQAKLGQVQ